jgi:hypothetical protein
MAVTVKKMPERPKSRPVIIKRWHYFSRMRNEICRTRHYTCHLSFRGGANIGGSVIKTTGDFAVMAVNLTDWAQNMPLALCV